MVPPSRDFLQEVPELKRLSDEPRIRSAIESHDAHRLYEALRHWRKQHPGNSEPWVETLLQKRRFFLKQGRTPRLGTFNGVGGRLYGSADIEQGPQGSTYIATYFLVVLFLPLFPFSEHLVSRVGSNRYQFFGRVPLSEKNRWWRRAFGLGLLVLALGAAAVAWQRAQNTQVQLANGLPIPVLVQFGNHKIRVGPASRTHVGLHPGPYLVRATRNNGELVEETRVEVPRWTDFVAYNVLGSAPLYLSTIVYSTTSTAREATDPITSLGGQSFSVRDGVQYLFEEPPQHVEMSGDTETRLAVDMAKGGWRNTVSRLLYEDRLSQARTLVSQLVWAMPDDGEVRDRALELFHRSGGNAACASLVQQWIQREPDDGGDQRLYVDALRGMGKRQEAIQFAAEHLKALPDSVEFAELLARAQDPEDAVKSYGELVAAHPHDLRLRHLYAQRLLYAGRPALALTQFEWVKTHDPERYSGLLADHARTLLALGRPRDAAALLERWAEKAKPPRWDDSLLHAELALHAAPGTTSKPVGYLASRLENESHLGTRDSLEALLAVWAGSPEAPLLVQTVKDALNQQSLRIRLVMKTDLAAALALAAKASERALARLDNGSALALALAARGEGNSGLAQRLEYEVSELRLDPEAAWHYVHTGEGAERLRDWNLDLQSVVQFERARQKSGRRGGPGWVSPYSSGMIPNQR